MLIFVNEQLFIDWTVITLHAIKKAKHEQSTARLLPTTKKSRCFEHLHYIKKSLLRFWSVLFEKCFVTVSRLFGYLRYVTVLPKQWCNVWFLYQTSSYKNVGIMGMYHFVLLYKYWKRDANVRTQTNAACMTI